MNLAFNRQKVVFDAYGDLTTVSAKTVSNTILSITKIVASQIIQPENEHP